MAEPARTADCLRLQPYPADGRAGPWPA